MRLCSSAFINSPTREKVESFIASSSFACCLLFQFDFLKQINCISFSILLMDFSLGIFNLYKKHFSAVVVLHLHVPTPSVFCFPCWSENSKNFQIFPLHSRSQCVSTRSQILFLRIPSCDVAWIRAHFSLLKFPRRQMLIKTFLFPLFFLFSCDFLINWLQRGFLHSKILRNSFVFIWALLQIISTTDERAAEVRKIFSLELDTWTSRNIFRVFVSKKKSLPLHQSSTCVWTWQSFVVASFIINSHVRANRIFNEWTLKFELKLLWMNSPNSNSVQQMVFSFQFSTDSPDAIQHKSWYIFLENRIFCARMDSMADVLHAHNHSRPEVRHIV